MAKLSFTGPFRHRLRSFLTLNRIAIHVHAHHLTGHRMAPDWDANTEIGIRFWRHQFTRAMTHTDIRVGRAIFNSLQTQTDDVYQVTCDPQDTPDGHWFTPDTIRTEAVLLYLHGGGYTFGGPISTRFAQMLAHHCGARVFMPSYRLTPEHAHPAQSDDALTAWQFLRQTIPAHRLIVIGDSAGGHMALTLIKDLRDRWEAQPALCIGLCPWTDIGDRGACLHGNDRFDMVQGWMALQFGAWLDPDGQFGREALSPINWDFHGLAPIYLQTGGREILRDMIIDFAKTQEANGASVMLDLWADMPHDFQIYDSLHISSTQALSRLATVIRAATDGEIALPALPAVTQLASGAFSGGSPKSTQPSG